jgi:hypothetical protein
MAHVGVLLSDIYSDRSIVIHKYGDESGEARPMIVHRNSPYYEPLHYVFMFTDGVLGWSPRLAPAQPVFILPVNYFFIRNLYTYSWFHLRMEPEESTSTSPHVMIQRVIWMRLM